MNFLNKRTVNSVVPEGSREGFKLHKTPYKFLNINSSVYLLARSFGLARAFSD